MMHAQNDHLSYGDLSGLSHYIQQRYLSEQQSHNLSHNEPGQYISIHHHRHITQLYKNLISILSMVKTISTTGSMTVTIHYVQQKVYITPKYINLYLHYTILWSGTASRQSLTLLLSIQYLPCNQKYQTGE